MTNALDFVLACDVMMEFGGSIRPAMYLADELVERGYNVGMMSPNMSDGVERSLRKRGVDPLNFHAKLITRNSSLSLMWFEAWAREAFLRLNSRQISNNCSVINFSQVIVTPSLVWYLQGPPSLALSDMEKEFSSSYRIAYDLLRPLIEYFDARLVKDMGCSSAFVLANSKFCASMYSRFGIHVQEVIYPPINCEVFSPSTSNPSSLSVLTYFGKETSFSVIKAIADRGVKIRAFGSKSPYIHKEVINHPNIEFLGKISTEELVDTYSNALFTLFPFTHEPFGYVPLESMACGTPVLTYNMQGPREYVVDGYTGWLAENDEEFIPDALELWAEGYPPHMRKNCTDAASKFDKKVYVEKWMKVLDRF